MTDVGLKTSGRFTRTERVRSQGAECVRGGVGADEKLREMKCFHKTYLDYLCKISIGKKVLAREVKFHFEDAYARIPQLPLLAINRLCKMEHNIFCS